MWLFDKVGFRKFCPPISPRLHSLGSNKKIEIRTIWKWGSEFSLLSELNQPQQTIGEKALYSEDRSTGIDFDWLHWSSSDSRLWGVVRIWILLFEACHIIPDWDSSPQLEARHYRGNVSNFRTDSLHFGQYTLSTWKFDACNVRDVDAWHRNNLPHNRPEDPVSSMAYGNWTPFA